MRYPITKALAVAAGLVLASAPVVGAGPDDESVVVIKAGRIITGSGDDISQGEIVIIDGKVRLVGKGLEYPKSARVIDAGSETVVPGMIHVRARPDMPDYNRNGVRGDLKASGEVYLSQIDFDPFVHTGFTTVAIFPSGNQVPGIASVYHTAGPEEDRLLSAPGYIRMTMNSQPRDKGTLRDAIKKAKAEIEKVEKARQEWEAKKKEAEAKKKAEAEKAQNEAGKEQPGPPSPPPPPSPQPHGPPAPPAADQKKPEEPAEFKAPEIDPTHRVFVDMLQKKAGVPAILMELGRASDYVHVADVLKDEKEIRRAYYLGGFPGQADFNYVVSNLGEEKALVVLPPYLHREPQTVTRYNLVGELAAAGCEVALVPTGDSSRDLETFRARAADMVRSGMERPDAIKALTINPARAIGAEKLLGSIEKGKLADLVFLDGDILDPLANVTRVMINGEIVWKQEEPRR